jgi:gp32 DNA binding protein like
MSVDFSKLKKSSGNLDTMKQKLQSMVASDSKSDKDNYWRPEVDKAGNGMATIRFLPAPAVDGDEGLPWAKVFSHGFQGPGGWLIDNCLTTKNQQCPVCEHNNKLWNSGIEANKDIVRKQKRKLNYIANVYIVNDPKHPENNGTVKLFKFGAKIFEKITEAMNPQFEDETPINPFDFWKGANFKLKITKVAGYQNYDKSEFESPSTLLDDDEELEKIWKSQHSLSALTDDKEFKTYDELKKRLDKVLGVDGEPPVAKTTVEQMKALPKSKPVAEDAPWSEPDVSEDDDMAYFSKLADE